MRLREWIARSGLTHSEAARRLGVLRVTMRSWLYDSKVPKAETMAHVERETGGDVSLRDWVAPFEPRPQGLTPLQHACLSDVRFCDAIHISDLADRTGKPLPSVRRAVAALRKRGLVAPADGSGNVRRST